MIQQLATAFFLSVLVVALAYWRGSLSRSGAAGALIVGTLTFGLGGWQWGVLLALFFISSSLLSHFKEGEKKAVAEKFDKGHRRDAGQVIANGGLGACIATLSAFMPAQVAPGTIWFVMFLGVMATVTADTWATELGTLSKRPPRLITTGRIVAVGTSGGISPLGTIVSLLGGLMIGLAAGLMFPSNFMLMGTAGAVGGLAGSLVDSLLGATVQRIYYSDSRQKETEKRFEKEGTPNRPLRGWAWMNNDMVNLLSSIIGGLTAVLLSSFLI
ncbi:MAG: DUF92 domain-containing protein [Candidatus Promineifilaceae bacterium]|nr:DUF92 domain-containing protein [Candidatus Promineifilaceae bacterium]